MQARGPLQDRLMLWGAQPQLHGGAVSCPTPVLPPGLVTPTRGGIRGPGFSPGAEGLGAGTPGQLRSPQEDSSSHSSSHPRLSSPRGQPGLRREGRGRAVPGPSPGGRRGRGPAWALPAWTRLAPRHSLSAPHHHSPSLSSKVSLRNWALGLSRTLAQTPLE